MGTGSLALRAKISNVRLCKSLMSSMRITIPSAMIKSQLKVLDRRVVTMTQNRAAPVVMISRPKRSSVRWSDLLMTLL